MAKSRARVIDNDVIEVVQEILSDWTGKLTWNLLIAAIKKGIGAEYTRQALANHEKITQEFNLRKRSLQLEAGRPVPADSRVDALQKRLDGLQAENERLIIECNNYRAKFFVWVHNAGKHGLSEKKLNEPLPHSMRGSTDDIVPVYDTARRKKG